MTTEDEEYTWVRWNDKKDILSVISDHAAFFPVGARTIPPPVSVPVPAAANPFPVAEFSAATAVVIGVFVTLLLLQDFPRLREGVFGAMLPAAWRMRRRRGPAGAVAGMQSGRRGRPPPRVPL